MKGHMEIVRMLLTRTKIDQNLPDWVGRSVLHNAAAYLREGQEDIIKFLVDNGADLEALDGEGGTALHCAIFRTSDQPAPTLALIKQLIDCKIPLDVRDNHGRTALLLAAVTQNLGALELLLKAGAKPNDGSFLCAIQTGRLDIIQPFLEPHTKQDLHERAWNEQTALHIAASQGFDGVVAKLLDFGASVRCCDLRKRTPLVCSQQYGRTSTVILLQSAQPEVRGDYMSREAQRLWGRSALHWAAEAGDDLSKFALDQSALNAQDDMQRSPLHLAVCSGSLQTVKQLISAQSPIDLTDSLGQTPLHYAAEQPSLEILEILISAGPELHALDKWSCTPLHLAVGKNRPVLVEALIKAGAQMRGNCDENTPLHDAIAAGYDTVAHILLETKGDRPDLAQRNRGGHTVFHLAAEYGRLLVLESLLERVPEASTVLDYQDLQGKTALHMASMRGHFDVVKKLLGSGAIANRLDKELFMPAHYAARAGYEKIVEALIDAIPNHVNHFLEKWDQALPNFPSETEGGDEAFFSCLIDLGALAFHQDNHLVRVMEKWAPENREGFIKAVAWGLQTFESNAHSIPSTFLMQAVKGGHEGMVKLILRKIPQMPLQALSYWQMNALSLAAKQGNLAIVKHLIDYNADLNAISDMQQTCLHEAAETGHAELIALLVQKGANPDLTRLRDGSTPLHLAAEEGHAKAVDELINVAFVNARDDHGQTPLHRAAMNGHESVVNLLLEAEVNVLIRDFEDHTALDVANGLGERICAAIQTQAMRQRVQRGS